MKSTERLRPLEQSHARHAHAILEQHYQNGEALGGGWTEEQLKNEIRIGRSLGLFVGHELRAFVLFRENETVFEITILATDPAHRGQGCMTRLIEGLLAQEPGREVWLEVHSKNLRAQRFYEKLSFQRVGQRKAYYRDQGDAILYSRR